ncbi:uncharacterized protein CDAR_393691 [Caerostris darwini]|uniref:Uncharacterized protein n=1 Tax=Caerostris darwini TaxID=1538125 RepID=A0AAV4WBG2_9ARAC|nr:uncharacterized protein CDAR_393691 [Caerostris darwini]
MDSSTSRMVDITLPINQILHISSNRISPNRIPINRCFTTPLDCRIFNVVTDLVPAVRKLGISCDVLRSISYATINARTGMVDNLYRWILCGIASHRRDKGFLRCFLFMPLSAVLHLLTTDKFEDRGMAEEPDDDELEAYLRSSLSDRRRSRWGRQSLRRGSSPFLTEGMAGKHGRRLSSFTTSSGE